MYGLALLLSPFIQVGITYYLSIATLIALLLFLDNKQNVTLLFHRLFIPRLVIALLMLLVVLSHDDAKDYDTGRAVREGGIFFLVTGCNLWAIKNYTLKTETKIFSLLTLVSGGLLLLVLGQSYLLHRGVYFGLPASFFIQNNLTLPGQLDLIYSKVRAMGTFGEPSYLGGYCLSLLFAFSSQGLDTRKKKILAVSLMVIVAASRSFSGIVFCSLYLAVNNMRQIRNKSTLLLFILLALAALPVILMTDNVVSERITQTLSGQDTSTLTRIIDPVKALPDLLMDHPGGISYGSHLLLADNGFFNLFFDYGFLGLLLIVPCLVYVFRSADKLLFLLFLSMQNGGFLTIDKFVLIGLSVMLYNSMKNQPKELAHDKS